MGDDAKVNNFGSSKNWYVATGQAAWRRAEIDPSGPFPYREVSRYILGRLGEVTLR